MANFSGTKSENFFECKSCKRFHDSQNSVNRLLHTKLLFILILSESPIFRTTNAFDSSDITPLTDAPLISGGRDIKMRRLVVSGVANRGAANIDVPEKTGNKDKAYEGATASGILLAASKGIDISGASVSGVISDESNAFVVRKIGDSDNIKINNSFV